MFAVLLLAQAGAPFTTGLWAKLQVVLATVSAGSVPLGVIAMVTAVIAGFFYLRLAALMYAGTSHGDGVVPVPARHDNGTQVALASPDGVTMTENKLNRDLLMTDEPAAHFGEETPSVVPVPVLTSVAIGLCVGVTVVFGVWPEPLLNFANHASLLFLGH